MIPQFKSKLIHVMLIALATNCPLPSRADTIPNLTKAAKIDPSMLVGAWTPSGSCSKERQLYLADGRFFSMTRRGNSWHTAFKGIYTLKDGLINVLDGPMTDGSSTLKIDTFTPTTLKVVQIDEHMGDPGPPTEGARFTLTKCGR